MARMAKFLTLQLAPVDDGPTGDKPAPGQAAPAEAPDLRRYQDAEAAIKGAIFRELVQARAWFECEISLRGFPAIAIQWVLVGETAAIVHLGRRPAGAPADATPHLLGACLLLGGFADADTAAIERARELEAQPGEVLFPPQVLDGLSEAPRPLLVQLGRTSKAWKDAMFHLTCRALADAFFDSLGQSDETDWGPENAPKVPGGE